MDGEKLINIICGRLRKQKKLTNDSEIVRELRNFKPQDLSLWKDRRVKNG